MPTYSLGDVTASNRAFALLKANYEREKLPPRETTTVEQILTWIHQDERNALALRVRREKRLQRATANQAEDDELDSEVTVGSG